MSEKYNSVFSEVLNFVRGTPMAAWLLIMSILLLVIGINGFIEDTNSSYIGIQQLETAFNVRATSWELTYLFMSLFFQIVSVVTFFMYLSNHDKNWPWLWVSFGFQLIDLVADVWYRSNGDPFQSFWSFAVATSLTIIFFTLGSEVAITIGLGLTAKLFVEGMTQIAIIFWSFLTGLSKFMKNVSTGHDKNSQFNGKPSQKNNTPSMGHYNSDGSPKYSSSGQKWFVENKESTRPGSDRFGGSENRDRAKFR